MSKLDQINSRPATLAFTSRVDAKHLATLALFWAKAGSTPRSTSELVRLSLEALSDILVTSGKADFVTSQEEAQTILGTLGLLPRIQPRNMLKAMVQEGSIRTDSLEVGVNLPKMTKKHITASSPELQLAQAKLDEALSADDNNRLEDQQQRTLDMLKALEMIPNVEGE